MWDKSAQSRPSSKAADARMAAPIPSHSATPYPAEPVALPEPGVQSSATEPARAAVAVAESAIASHLKIAGEISGNSDLYIDGEVRGKIRMAGARVTVGAKGRILADMEARELIIHGHVEGSLHATESLHLGASSRVQGKVLAPRIRIDDGASLRGTVETIAAGVAPKPVAALPKAPAVIHAVVPAATEHEEIIP
jgi:cytoskeletal protein CcmA (bactofilin family)